MGEQYLAGYRAAMQEVINFVREKHEHFDAEEGKVWDDRTDQRLKRGEPFVMYGCRTLLRYAVSRGIISRFPTLVCKAPGNPERGGFRGMRVCCVGLGLDWERTGSPGSPQAPAPAPASLAL